jgi:hypothetical protein
MAVLIYTPSENDQIFTKPYKLCNWSKCVHLGRSVDERHLRILRISVLAAVFALLLQDRALYVVINRGKIFVVCFPFCLQNVKY